MYIEESFDTIFNMGYGGGPTGPPPMPYASGKSPMHLRVKLTLRLTFTNERVKGKKADKLF